MALNASTSTAVVDNPFGEVIDPTDLVFDDADRAHMLDELRHIPAFNALMTAVESAA